MVPQLSISGLDNRHSRDRRMLGNLSSLSSSESDEEFDDTNVSAPSLFRSSRSQVTPRLEIRASEGQNVDTDTLSGSTGITSTKKSTSKRSLKPSSPRERVLMTPLRRVKEKRSTPLKQPPVSRRSIEEALGSERSVKKTEKEGFVDVEGDIIRSNKLISDDNKFSPKRGLRVAGSPFRDRTDEKSSSPRSDVKIRPIELGISDIIRTGEAIPAKQTSISAPISARPSKLFGQDSLATPNNDAQTAFSTHEHIELDIFGARSYNSGIGGSKISTSKIDLATNERSLDKQGSPRLPVIERKNLPEESRREILSQINATIESFRDRDTSRGPTPLVHGSSASISGENDRGSILLPIEPDYGEKDGFTRVNSEILQENHDILRELNSYIEPPPPPINFGNQILSQENMNPLAIENQNETEPEQLFIKHDLYITKQKPTSVDQKVSLSGVQRRELIKKLEKSELQKRLLQNASLDRETGSPIHHSKSASKPSTKDSKAAANFPEPTSELPAEPVAGVETETRGNKRPRNTSEEDFLDASVKDVPEWLNMAWSKLNSIVNLGLLSEKDIVQDKFLQKTLRVSESELSKRVRFLVKLNNKVREDERRKKRRKERV